MSLRKVNSYDFFNQQKFSKFFQVLTPDSTEKMKDFLNNFLTQLFNLFIYFSCPNISRYYINFLLGTKNTFCIQNKIKLQISKVTLKLAQIEQAGSLLRQSDCGSHDKGFNLKLSGCSTLLKRQLLLLLNYFPSISRKRFLCVLTQNSELSSIQYFEFGTLDISFKYAKRYLPFFLFSYVFILIAFRIFEIYVIVK